VKGEGFIEKSHKSAQVLIASTWAENPKTTLLALVFGPLAACNKQVVQNYESKPVNK
jgi:hypothetical protein